jgi:hypothetical protein
MKMTGLLLCLTALGALAACTSQPPQPETRKTASADLLPPTSYTCTGRLVGTKLHGRAADGGISGQVIYTSSPSFGLSFQPTNGEKGDIMGNGFFCGQSIEADRCIFPSTNTATGVNAIINCENSGKEFRHVNQTPAIDGNFWFQGDHGKLECWNFVQKASQRPQKTLIQFENCVKN